MNRLAWGVLSLIVGIGLMVAGDLFAPSQRDWTLAISIAAGVAGWTGVLAGGWLLRVGRPSEETASVGAHRWEARDIAPIVSLSYLLVFFSYAAPGFLRYATVIAVLKQGSAQAIVAAGLTFVLLAAEIDLAVGMLALWAACLCGRLNEAWAGGAATGTTAMAAVLLPLATCLMLGCASGLLTVWSRLPSFIITLAMMFIAEGLAKYLTQGAMLDLPPVLATLGNGEMQLGRLLGLPTAAAGYLRLPYNALIAAAVFAFGHVVLQHTRFGRCVYMTGGNREAARLAGVRTASIVVACLAISALAAGVGGLLNAGRMGIVTVDQNKELLLNAVACVVLGGTSLFGGEGSMGKTILGVVTFTVLNVGLMQIDWINDLARQLLTGIVLLAALVVNGVLAKGR